jgi:site-specific DNA-methyltransferase (adenine-specific)
VGENVEINLGLYLGDCLAGMRALPSKSVHLIATDPPYGIGYVTNHRKFENDIAREVANDSKFDSEWFEDIVIECHRILEDDTHAYFFCADTTLPEMQVLVRKHFTFKNVLVWKKGNWTAGDLEGAYGKECEFVIFAQKGRRELIGGRPSSHIFVPRVDPDKSLHSCQKPVSLMSFLIEHSTREGEIVCDPFSGSASTAIAALGLGRKFIGWELDPKTYEIATARLDRDQGQMKLF